MIEFYDFGYILYGCRIVLTRYRTSKLLSKEVEAYSLLYKDITKKRACRFSGRLSRTELFKSSLEFVSQSNTDIGIM